MAVFEYIIGMVKTNTKGFYKETIENITSNWLGGSHLSLNIKSVAHGDRPLIAIVYK